jgi:hypothetical protein
MKKIMVAMFCLLAVAVLSAEEYEKDPPPSETKYYDNAKVIRIKNVEGEGFVQRSFEEGYEEATANLSLFDKDRVGTSAGRLGIYLGRLNYMRLDSETMIELLSVPQLRATDLAARIEKGSIYLDIENLDKEKGIEIQTPDCGVFLLDRGLYRINVVENSLTEIVVIEGIAEVAGKETSRNVRENQKIVMSRGQVEERPYYFYASDRDDFDRWNDVQSREQGYARYGTARYLQDGYEDYEYEMSRAGRWSYMSEFNSYVWIPYFSNSSWMPYANGRWIVHPYYGYVWISYDNCGWFTHHYGRWHWDYSSGWYWIPAYRWSPAWVSWFWDNDYYGWCPISWWNRPVVIIHNHWDRRYNYRRGIPHNSRSTIIIRKHEISAPNAMRVALRKDSLGPAGDRLIAYRGSAPSDRIAINRVPVVNAHGQTMLFKQNGIGSSNKYRVHTDSSQVAQGSGLKGSMYKYSPPGDAAVPYAPRSVYRKGTTPAAEARSDTGYRSKSYRDSSSKARDRSANSGGSGSADRPASREKSGGTSSSATSSSSSSSSDSAQAAKKKRDEAAYMALLRSENSGGYKGHGSGYAATRSQAPRAPYPAYVSRSAGSRSAGIATESPAAASRSTRYGETIAASPDYSRGYTSSRAYSAPGPSLGRTRPSSTAITTASRSGNGNSQDNGRVIHSRERASQRSSGSAVSSSRRSFGRTTTSSSARSGTSAPTARKRG